MRRRPPQDRPRLPPQTSRAIERVVFSGGTAQVKVVKDTIKVQAVTAHIVSEQIIGKPGAAP